MMNNRNYFVYAVMIAILIPIAMSSIYFMNMYKKRSDHEYISQVQNKHEVLLLGDIELNSLKSTRAIDAPASELLVKYTYGTDSLINYNIYLDSVTIPEYLDLAKIRWELYMYDEKEKKYLGLSFGNMSNIKNGKINISPNLIISKEQTQKFKLNYYYNSENSENTNLNFYAKVIIE